MPTERRQPLLNRSVLVTRPAHQSAALCRLIEEAGGIPLRLPALLIAPPEDPARARRQLQQLAGYGTAIFISRNAVEQALELLHPAPLPAIRLLAVGQATADALRVHGYAVALTPDREFSSEGLLALPGLQHVPGQHIAIIRGNGGRELLAETLRARGAIVECIETYRRIRPPAADELREILSQGKADLVLATSNQILENLLEMSGDARGRLIRRPLVVLSARTRDAALAAGFTQVYIAPRSDDNGIVGALLRAASECF